ncbi:hypothetical protein AB7M42_004156 [Bradyrhizobium diazoefficiens]|nr:hypothetical protein [Bradyrhizobium japonicum]MBP1093386.1 hypothetical protein [Bradyrhizobium japonicum]
MRCKCIASRASKDERPGCSRAVALRGSPCDTSQDEHLRVTVINWCSRPVGFPNRRHIFASSRLASPELCFIATPSDVRGRREGRVPARHPRSTVRKVATKNLHSGIQVKPNTRPSLRSGLTAYAAFSPGSDALLPPSPCGSLMCAPGRAAASPQDLAHRPRAPGRHGFAVRRSHRSCARRPSLTVARPAMPSRRCD